MLSFAVVIHAGVEGLPVVEECCLYVAGVS